MKDNQKIMDLTLDIEYLAIESLIPYEKNPRKNKKAIEPVKKSIKTYGFRQPIVTDENLVILVGHTRLLAAKELGFKTVPVHIAKDLSEEQKIAYRIADNKTAEFATWDKNLLLMEMKDLGDLYTGFEDFILSTTEIGSQVVEPKYEVIIVEVDSKYTQKELYERLTSEGHKCKVVMI